MARLEHRIRLVSGAAISLIVGGCFLYLNTAVEGALHSPINREAVLALRGTLIGTAIMTCFLVMIANYMSTDIVARILVELF